MALCGLALLGSTPTPKDNIYAQERYSQDTVVIAETTLNCDSEVIADHSIVNMGTLKEVLLAIVSEGEELDLREVVFYEEEEILDLGFDTADYLPEDFNPFANPENFMDISYLEEESEMDLGFDTREYLPEGFDPYEPYFDLNSIEYIEEEEEIELNFDTSAYLPKGFDPYSR